jgi:peroxiredoxin
LALTPELDRSISTTEKHQLQFEVLSDGNKVAKQYGIVFKLTDAVAEVYQEGFDLHGFNGDESDELPLAATYVIDQNGVIVYTF